MDANRVQEQSKELVDKLLSADASDVTDAVNQYFQADATIRTGHILLHGADKIKQLGLINSLVRKQSGKIIDSPQYHQKSQTIRYASTITYTSPNLPSFIPLAAQFSGFETSSQWDFCAHLQKADEEGKKLYVAKLEAKRREPNIIDRTIPGWILRPVATYLTLIAVVALSFFQQHRGEGPAAFIMAAITELISGMWSFIAPEVGRRQEQADKWRGEKVPQIKQYIQNASSQAFDTAQKVQADLEARAKNAGIPIDDYKTRATQAIADLTENVEARAKAAGMPTEEYRKQAEQAIEELKRRAAEMGDYIEGKAGEVKEGAEKQAGQVKEGVEKQAGEAKKAAGVQGKKDKHTRENSNALSQDQPAPTVESTGAEAGRPDEQRAQEIRDEFDQVPHTPLGGHDPTAANAPSFALAAAV